MNEIQLKQRPWTKVTINYMFIKVALFKIDENTQSNGIKKENYTSVYVRISFLPSHSTAIVLSASEHRAESPTIANERFASEMRCIMHKQHFLLWNIFNPRTTLYVREKIMKGSPHCIIMKIIIHSTCIF